MKDPYEIRFSVLQDREYMDSWISEESRKFFPFSTDEEQKNFLDNWIGFSKYRSSVTALIKGTPCAIATLYLMPYRKISHSAIIWMLISPQEHNSELGSIMLRNVIHLAKTYFVMNHVNVEVFENSPIIPMIKSFEFELIIRHKKYARIDGEYFDRLIYMKNI